jgi:glutaredoxin
MKNQLNWIILFLLLCLLSLPISSAVSAEIYKWKDKDGNIVFSDSPPPPGVDAEIKKFKEEPKERPKAKEDLSKTKIESLREKRPYGSVNVIMYMTSWCGFCRKAREYIRSLDVNLIEYDVEKDRSKREEFLRKSSGGGVPLIDVEGIIIKGYNPGAIKEAVEKRRNL